MSKVKRYTIAFQGTLEKRHLFSKKERIEDLYKRINEYNSKKNNPYFIGDLTFNYKTRVLYYRRYTKLSNPNELYLLDKLTTQLENEESLKYYYNVSDKNKLFIVYRASKKIKLLNIFYKKDIRYLNEYYLESKFIEYGKDIKFLRRILSNNLVSSYVHSKDQYEILYSNLELLKNIKDTSLVNVSPVVDFLEAFIYPKGEKSYYNLRLLANLVREYENTNKIIEDEEEILYYNQIPGQIMLDAYQIGCLSHFNEDIKMREISEEEAIRKLIIKL